MDGKDGQEGQASAKLIISVCNVSDTQMRHFKPYILCIFNFFI